MKKYYDVKDFQKDLKNVQVPLCNRFREEMTQDIVIDESSEITFEHIHEEYTREYDLNKVCEILKISPEVISGAKGATDMISSCYCTHNKESGNLSELEFVFQVAPKTKIYLNRHGEMQVINNNRVGMLDKATRDKIFASSESLNDFLDMITLIDVNTEKLLAMNKAGKSGTRAYKKLMEVQDKLKQDYLDQNYKLDPKLARASAKDIADGNSSAFVRNLDKVLVEEKLISRHGDLEDKQLLKNINNQIKETVNENLYKLEVNNILD